MGFVIVLGTPMLSPIICFRLAVITTAFGLLARPAISQEEPCECPVDAPAAGSSATLLHGETPVVLQAAWHLPTFMGDTVYVPTAVELQAEVALNADAVPEIKDPVIYTDFTKPLDQRVDDLVRRMSIKEKVGQMGNDAPAIDRLNVPAYNYWNEALHGVARAGTATVFPQTIGLAAMWSPTELHAIADTIATEARGKYNDGVKSGPYSAQQWQYYGLTFWTPNINLFRDPRWGRGQETYGEDTYLTSRMAVAFITGLQGDDPNYIKALATAKHFAVHSGPESTRHTINVEPSEADFYNNYLPHFEAAVREAHVGTVMGAYNRVYGASASASPLLLTKILRDTWGFQGHVVSDCDSVEDIWKTHKIVATQVEAVALALKAGLDLNCGFGTQRPPQYHAALADAWIKGLVTEHDIDQALHRVLRSRFQLGMFDPPEKVPFSKYTLADVDTPEHSALALKAAHDSMVLLKNDGALPLDKTKLKKLAVIGPNADSTTLLLGNYNGTPSNPVSILQGIRNVASAAKIEVTYSAGCPLVPGFPAARGARGAPATTLTDAQQQTFNDAVALARDADAVIYVGGISAQLEGEEMSTNFDGFSGGDRTRIELPAIQTKMLQALKDTGKPVIFVNCSGSAIAMPWEAENIPAILQAWYPGENGGTAVADVLFGDYNPAGRLPVTFYQSTADLPAFDDYSMAHRTYRYFTGKPLFAFGHGLSYTKFQYGSAKLAGDPVANDGTVKIFVDVANSGDRDGEEVVQVYAHPRGNTDPLVPRQRLVAFQRISIPKGQHVNVELNVPTQNLRLWDSTKKSYTVTPGDYDFQIGAASDDIRQTAVVKIAAAK